MLSLLLTTPLSEIYGYTPEREQIVQDLIHMGRDGYQLKSAKELENALCVVNLNFEAALVHYARQLSVDYTGGLWRFDENGCYRLMGTGNEKFKTKSPLSHNEKVCTIDEFSMIVNIAAFSWFVEGLYKQIPDEVYNSLVYWLEKNKQINSDSYLKVDGYDSLAVQHIIN